MKILIYGINYSPELTGIGKYTGEMAEWLAAQGHDVNVITAPPYYPQWKVKEGYKASRYASEIVNGVRVHRVPIWIPENPSGTRRMLHLLSFAITSVPVVLGKIWWRPDVVVNIEPPFVCVPFGLFLGRLTGAVNWLHIQDYEIDAAFALDLLRGGLVKRLAVRIERHLMQSFDWVTTISEAMHRKAISKGVDSRRAGLLYNWVDSSEIKPSDRLTTYRTNLGIDSSQIVMLYSGNMGNKQGLEILADAAEILGDVDSIRFVFCGDGSGRADLERRCSGRKNVHFLPLQPVESLNELLATADVHLLPQRAGAADLVMPSKLLGMLASGRPVVATAGLDTELGSVVSQCGTVVPTGDGEAFAAALKSLATDVVKRHQLGEVGRAIAIKKFSKESVLLSLEEELVSRRSARNRPRTL